MSPLAMKKFWLLSFLAYFACAILFTWPLVLDSSGSILGYLGVENTAQTLWLYNAWKMYQKDLLVSMHQQYGTMGLFFHLGEYYNLALAFSERHSVANGLDFIWTLPLEAIFGFPLYYNVKCWLILCFNGLAMALLVHSIVPSKSISWTLGFLYAFNPFHLHLLSVGCLIESQTFWPCLAAWSFIRLWKNDHWSHWVLGGALLGLTADNYWFYGHFVFIFALVFALYHISLRSYPAVGPKAVNLLFFGLAFFVVVLPFAQPYLLDMVFSRELPGMVRPDPGSSPSQSRWLEQLVRYSAEPDYPFTTTIPEKMVGKFSPHGYLPSQLTMSANLFLLALIPAVILRKGGFWLLGSLVFYLLPLGPYLKHGGMPVLLNGHYVPLPYLVFAQYLPLLDRLFWPGQSMFLCIMCLSVLLSLNLQYLFSMPKMTILKRNIVLFLIVLCSCVHMHSKMQMPCESVKLSTPGFYQAVLPNEGFIFLPVSRKFWQDPKSANSDFYYSYDLTLVDLHLVMTQGKGLFGRTQYGAYKDYWLYQPDSLSSQPFLAWLTSLGHGKYGSLAFVKNSELANKDKKSWESSDSVDFTSQDLRDIYKEGFKYIFLSERLCAHVKHLGSYRLDPDRGRENYRLISQALQSKFGPCVYKGKEYYYDQKSLPTEFVKQPYRYSIYKIKPELLENK